MDREIQHILSVNYPNPPPPGFRYPPLPRIIQLNEHENEIETEDRSEHFIIQLNENEIETEHRSEHLIIQLNENEIETEYCYSDEHLSFKTVTNMESEEDEFHDTLSCSIDESMEVSPVVEEYVKTTTVSNKILEDIVEETVEHNVQKAESIKILKERVKHDLQTAESNKILEDMIEERVEQDLQNAKKTEPIEAETKNVKEILNINKIDNSLLIVNETNLNQVDQLNKHQFFKYPHSPPFGFHHMFIPKIAPCYSEKENVNIENHNRTEQNCDEQEKITNQLESIILNKPDVSEQNRNKQQTENENHSIIEKNVINSQPKTTDKDQQVNKLYKKTDEVVGKERVEQRIKTTICCCIKI